VRNFAKSVLNYFAAFSETRFRFNRKLPYEWSDDSFTLDFSVFPDFQREMLAAIAGSVPFCLRVPKGKYAVALDPVTVTAELTAVVQTNLHGVFLESQVTKAKAKLLEALPDEDPQIIESRALADGLREYNLSFRREMLGCLTALQARRISDLQAELGFTTTPPSTFNPQREVQYAYDCLQNLARNRKSTEGYVNDVLAYLRKQDYRFVIFDLHLGLRSFLQLAGTRPVYAFFHEICKGQQKYPLFSVEIDSVEGNDVIELRSTRDLVMLNTPAVNSFEFDTVLTTPRACRFAETLASLSGVERFLQAKFKASDSFILQPHYRPLIADNLPTVRFRIGLQAVKDDDRRILDYSELITSLDDGAGHKFTDLVSRYVEGNVHSTADEVDREYRERCPRRSAERLVPEHLMVPMPLNETQRRILTAAENPRNELIVVDGPPGTGKSYTITALVYLADQLGKSVVITSHKRQALDVIDQAITNQFKNLHPQAKPSVLRLEKENGPGRINSIANTLSTQAINAARRRSQSLNEEAVKKDRERVRETLTQVYERYWRSADNSEADAKALLEWAQLNDALIGAGPNQTDLLPLRLLQGTSLDLTAARRLAELIQRFPVVTSIESLGALFAERQRLSDVLKQCDELSRLINALPSELLVGVQSVPPELAAFSEIVARVVSCVEPGTLLGECYTAEIALAAPNDDIGAIFTNYPGFTRARETLAQIANYEGGLLGRIFKAKPIAECRQRLAHDTPRLAEIVNNTDVRQTRNRLEALAKHLEAAKSRNPILTLDYILSGTTSCSPVDLQQCLRRLGSLEFQPVISLVEKIHGAPAEELTIAQVHERVSQLNSLARYLDLRQVVEGFARHFGMGVEDLPKLYTGLKQASDLLAVTQADDLAALSSVFRLYGPFLKALGIEASDVSSLGRFVAEPERAARLFRYLQLHMDLSARLVPVESGSADTRDYFEKSQKLLQSKADQQFSNLLNHSADVQRILTAVAAGKRITREQADVLLQNLSCVISAPELISQHFPMQPDIIDLLIIDEASQVSIAESISLMLRAKQTIVFGDELQYGAVAAVNVSREYSEYYFKDILRDYATDRSVTISEAEQERLAREASIEPDEETAESSTLIPLDPGTREWLKTFSIRTSTLAFAKALQNYSASLNVHFRSFPEIISYSNDVFYRPSQIELVTNRIRTKPIGEVLRFIKVDTKGNSGRNVNLDEIEAIQQDIEAMIAGGYQGTIGIICSFKEQQARMEEIFRQEMAIHPDLVRKHKFTIWFVGDVQGEERDLVYYSFVQEKKFDNADLRTIYPTIGGTADSIRRLKMQRLNVGFSRAKDIMVFVHSMPLGDYSDTRLGDALRHYDKVRSAAHDHYVTSESVFGSPAEKELYALILQTPFFRQYQESLRLIAQFEIGKYIRQEYHRYIPKYRVDFLLTMSDGGKEKSLIIEYDGLEYHTKNPDVVTAVNFDREYLEYDVERQLELQSYGYTFLRINKFSLVPDRQGATRVDMLDQLLRRNFAS
jgi:very-short-patch-repair endonuclease